MTAALTDDERSRLDQRLDESLTLVVGRRRTGKPSIAEAGEPPRDELLKLRLDEDVASAFKELCRSAADTISSAPVRAYTADAELEGGEVFVLRSDSDLAELALFREIAADAATKNPIRPSELDTNIGYYIIAVGDEERVAFVRKADPRLRHKAGKILASGRDKLISVTGPLFSFATNFDFVVAPGWAVILQQHRFEQLFRETGLVARHVSQWVKSVTDHLPMPASSVSALEAAATTDSRLWRRLRAIHSRGHLKQVGIEKIRRYAGRVNLDVEKIIHDDELIFDPSERFTIMHLLNEDLFRGELTQELFEAQRKSPAGG